MAPMRKLLALVLTISAVSLAQTQPAERSRVQVIDCEGDDVLGKTEVPLAEPTTVKRGAEFGSIIKVRTDFKDKLLNSVHEM